MVKLKELILKKEEYIENLKNRGLDNLIPEFQKSITIYQNYLKKLKEIEELRHSLNLISKEINIKKEMELINQAKKIKDIIKSNEDILFNLKKEIEKIELILPNWIDKQIPIAAGDENVKVIKYSNLEKKPFTIHHYDLVGKYIDQEKAGEISGSRFYYLFNELVFLDLAISMYSLDFFYKKGFKNLMIPPYLVRKEVEEKITYYEAFKESIFEVEGDLILIPTSEHPIVAYYENKILEKEELPIKILAWSPAFRKEAGSHGKDTKGIFRVKQFHKTELHILTEKDKDMEEIYKLGDILIEFLESLNIPNRLVIVPSMEMDKRAFIQLDIEGWFPAQNKYRELGSIATTTTWISEKLKIRYRIKGTQKELIRNVYSTGVAVERTITALIENNYNPDKKCINIPKPLLKYLDFDCINMDEKQKIL